MLKESSLEIKKIITCLLNQNLQKYLYFSSIHRVPIHHVRVNNAIISGQLTLSLPNATVVEFTLHCQTRLQSKFKGTVDSCLFLTVIRDANLCFLFQNV